MRNVSNLAISRSCIRSCVVLVMVTCNKLCVPYKDIEPAWTILLSMLEVEAIRINRVERSEFLYPIPRDRSTYKDIDRILRTVSKRGGNSLAFIIYTMKPVESYICPYVQLLYCSIISHVGPV